MDDKREKVVRLIDEIKELRQKENELYSQAQEILGLKDHTQLDYWFFDAAFNDTDFNIFWENYLNSEF